MFNATSSAVLRFVAVLFALTASAFGQSSLVGVTHTDFSIMARGGVVRTADGSAKDVAVGYATVQPDAGSPSGAGIAVISNVIGGTLVSEVGVPAVRVLQNGRMYVEVLGSTNTGLAIANPNDSDATISFAFTDSNGVDSGAGTIAIPARGQISKFLNEPPFNSGSLRGTFSFTSTLPVAVLGLRGLINERGEFLMSSIPVVDTALPPGKDIVVVPHFAIGSGWSTEIILVNPTDSVITGNIRLFGHFGDASTFGVDGQTLPGLPYSIPPRSSFRTRHVGAPGHLATESIHIEPSVGEVSPSATALLIYKPETVTVAQATIGAASGLAFRMYVAASGTGGLPGSIQSGVAVANTSASATTVTYELSAMDGTILGQTSAPISGNGQLVAFLSDIFGQQRLSLPAQGILRVSTSGSPISVAALRGRYNERGDFLITTTPPADEGTPPNSSLSVFPEIADGGGYATQFVMFGRSSDAAGLGNMMFAAQNGSPLTLNWRTYRVGGDVSAPTVTHRIEAVYSDAARQAKITGSVLVSAVVHEDGSLSITQFTKSLGYGLDENVRAALTQWRFDPARLGGQAVPVSLSIEVTFNLY